MAREIIDPIQTYLEGECKTQVWARNHLSKPIQQVDRINKMTISSVRQVLKPVPEHHLQMASLTKLVCDYYSVDTTPVFGKGRARKYVKPRQVSIYLIRKIFNISFPEIGRFFKKNNATIIWSVNTVNNEISVTEQYKYDVNILTEKIINAGIVISYSYKSFNKTTRET